LSDQIKGNKGADFEIVLYTFGDIVKDPRTGPAVSAGQRVKEIVEAVIT
jgi:hypothetical protein